MPRLAQVLRAVRLKAGIFWAKIEGLNRIGAAGPQSYGHGSVSEFPSVQVARYALKVAQVLVPLYLRAIRFRIFAYVAA